MRKRIPSNRTSFKAGYPISEAVARVLAAHYFTLKKRLRIEAVGNYLSMSYEDMFHNAILYTIQDAKAAQLTTEDEVLEYFEHKYRSVVLGIIKDSHLINRIEYADNKQTEEDPQE